MTVWVAVDVSVSYYFHWNASLFSISDHIPVRCSMVMCGSGTWGQHNVADKISLIPTTTLIKTSS